MRNIVTELRPLAADITSLSHDCYFVAFLKVILSESNLAVALT